MNAQLNDVTGRVSTLRGSAPERMAELHVGGERFDVVVLDPPAFIQRRKDLKKGIAAYRRINELALRLLEPGGLLVSASCSMHLPRADLVKAVQRAAVRTGCEVRVVAQGGQGPDHPIHPRDTGNRVPQDTVRAKGLRLQPGHSLRGHPRRVRPFLSAAIKSSRDTPS